MKIAKTKCCVFNATLGYFRRGEAGTRGDYHKDDKGPRASQAFACREIGDTGPPVHLIPSGDGGNL
jgi:hypothetical protein